MCKTDECECRSYEGRAGGSIGALEQREDSASSVFASGFISTDPNSKLDVLDGCREWQEEAVELRQDDVFVRRGTTLGTAAATPTVKCGRTEDSWNRRRSTWAISSCSTFLSLDLRRQRQMISRARVKDITSERREWGNERDGRDTYRQR